MSETVSIHTHTKLGQWFATAICGNDILSSALYVSGIAIMFAGIYAPLVLIGIVVVLLLYKAVYTEVVEALPVNGGAYNCLLSSTSKTVAAIAGVMTVLSYIATAVISAKVGVEYLHTIFQYTPVIIATVILLFIFAVLVISGIKDSARVALGIFATHIVTLLLFLILGFMYYLTHGTEFFHFNFAHTGEILTSRGGLLPMLYLAFSASLLGVSGFESSANFVEEQQKGVFRKTLRNMLIGVAIFNPLIALIVLNSMPFEAIIGAKDFLLADTARVLGGPMFQYLVVIDAFLVLSGAVLTAYVGVSGLMNRMAADSCFPRWLAKTNRRGSYPRIVMSFFILCSSILILTKGNLLSLAGVYTISFLGVMSAFAFGNLILKETRSELKRTYSAPRLFVVLALCATLFGMLGNIRIDGQNLIFFEIYFIPALLVVLAVIYQDYVIRFFLRIIPNVRDFLLKHFEQVIQDRYVVFIYNVHRLFQILSYIHRNETGRQVVLVYCKVNGLDREHDENFHEMQRSVAYFQRAGGFPHLNVTLEYKDQPFGPDMIDNVAKEYNVTVNRVFIGSIHQHHEFDYADLKGARIIF